MKKRLLALFAAVLLIAVFVFVPRPGGADLGDFSGGGDYGGGGGDYGGGGGDYGGGSDWVGSDYSGGDYGTTRSSSPVSRAVTVIAIVVMLIIVSGILSNKRKSQSSSAPGATRTAASMLTPIEQYKERDPNFSPEDFKEWLQNLYFKMQDCCTKRDVEPIRPYFADSLYQQFNRQMIQLKSLNRTNHVERIAVLSVELKGFYEDKGEDVIVAELYTRITDYTTDDATGKVVAGSKDHEKFMTYEYSLSRPIGKTTEAFEPGVTERHCPNCGAPLSVNESIKCPFCDSVLSFGDHDWTVYAIKGISQRTV